MNVSSDLIVHSAIVVLVVIGATILSVQGTLESEAVSIVYGAAIGYAGGQAASSSGSRDTRKAVNGTLSGELGNPVLVKQRESE